MTKNNNSIFQIFFGWFLLMFFGYGGYLLGAYVNKQQQVDYKSLVDNNSRIIHSLGVTANTQSVCTGVIQEIAEELRNKENKFDVKPTKGREKPLWEMYGDFKPDPDVPQNYEQLINDQTEINLSIRSLGFGNIFMEDSLRNILKQIKSKEEGPFGQ